MHGSISLNHSVVVISCCSNKTIHVSCVGSHALRSYAFCMSRLFHCLLFCESVTARFHTSILRNLTATWTDALHICYSYNVNHEFSSSHTVLPPISQPQQQPQQQLYQPHPHHHHVDVSGLNEQGKCKECGSQSQMSQYREYNNNALPSIHQGEWLDSIIRHLLSALHAGYGIDFLVKNPESLSLLISTSQSSFHCFAKKWYQHFCKM